MGSTMTNEERTLLPEIIMEAEKLSMQERAIALGWLIARATEHKKEGA